MMHLTRAWRAIYETCSSFPRRATVVLCLSGGVDSSVAAAIAFRCVYTRADIDALLRYRRSRHCLPAATLTTAIRDGVPLHQLLEYHLAVNTDALPLSSSEKVAFRAVFMNNWRSDENDNDDDDIPSKGPHGFPKKVCENVAQEFESANTTVRMLNNFVDSSSSSEKQFLSLSMLDFSEQYRHRCLSPLLAAFASGGSCNVDVLCNSNIKFGCLLDHCRQHINDDSYLVTGHYARHVRVRTPGTPDRSVLARPVTWSSGTDVLNDQTHFLADVCLEKQLPSALFPLGALFESKSDVRRVAEELDLQHVARKKTSTGLCFVNEHMKSSRKQAAGAFPMWLHSQRLQDSAAEDRDSPHDAADETMRPTKWMLLCPGDSDGLETMRDVTRDVRGLHCDQRHELFEHRREEESLPAYFVTQGERLHLLMRRRSPLQDVGASVERFYVARKILRPTSKKGLSVFSCEDDVTDTSNTMGLAVIILSRSNDISSMLFREVDVALRHNWDHATPCSQLFVAFRHQDSMMPCAIRHVKPGRATVTLQGGHQARCPVPGQLAVFYARTGDGDGELTAVVGCGWIA